jgi:DNA-binding GntR family transcriptional regulator
VRPCDGSTQLHARGHEHVAILDACTARDPDSAAIALHDHMATTANNVSEAMGAEPLFSLNGY